MVRTNAAGFDFHRGQRHQKNVQCGAVARLCGALVRRTAWLQPFCKFLAIFKLCPLLVSIISMYLVDGPRILPLSNRCCENAARPARCCRPRNASTIISTTPLL